MVYSYQWRNWLFYIRCSRPKGSKNPSKESLVMNHVGELFEWKLWLSPQVGSVRLELGCGWLYLVWCLHCCSCQLWFSFASAQSFILVWRQCIPNIPSDLNSSMSTQNLFLVRLVVRVSWYFSLFLPYTLRTSILDFHAHTKPCRRMVYTWYNSATLFTFVFYPKMLTFVFITSVISTLDTLTS